MEIDRFRVMERWSGHCLCALYPFADHTTHQAKFGEIACITTDANHRGAGRGERLLRLLCDEAKQQNIEHVFVLTTQTSHWFVEQGFEATSIDALLERGSSLQSAAQLSGIDQVPQHRMTGGADWSWSVANLTKSRFSLPISLRNRRSCLARN